jgi:hypothetical protein
LGIGTLFSIRWVGDNERYTLCGLKHRSVATLGNADADRFLGTFRIKIVVEPPTEFTGFNPHDIVICRVIPKAAPKNV